MGNSPSKGDDPNTSMENGPDSPPPSLAALHGSSSHRNADANNESNNSRFKGFPGSAILEKAFCGSIDTTDPSEYQDVGLAKRLLHKADILCVSSPTESTSQGLGEHEPFYEHAGSDDDEDDLNDPNSPRRYSRDRTHSGSGGGTQTQVHPSSAMLARALVSEVTDNPATLPAKDMTEREYKLMKAQQAAKSAAVQNRAGHYAFETGMSPRPVGTNGPGVGPPDVLGSLAHAVLGDDAPTNFCEVLDEDANPQNQSLVGGMMSTLTGRAPPTTTDTTPKPPNPHRITLGLSLSRRDAQGHPDTVTRQTAFDWNDLQDRAYKYVSATDSSGWRAGGGEPGGPVVVSTEDGGADNRNYVSPQQQQQSHSSTGGGLGTTLSGGPATPQQVKEALPDTVHITIMEIDCPDAATVDQVIHALASGEIFIPHMSVLPESLSVNGSVSPPDLIVKFGCERNDDLPPDEWPNWCLEFMHNQLYEYFYNAGAVWTTRPFHITLAQKVRWKTVKHMNRYFAHAERVIEAWREQGPQYLDPQLTYIEGGATPEEVARPHGIYLLRNGVPTNYFCPNFDPPYTTKMTRSLLNNVLQKSWDKKRREWTSQPIPKLITPVELMAAACGCADPSAGGGFLATQVTSVRPALSREQPYTTTTTMPASPRVVKNNVQEATSPIMSSPEEQQSQQQLDDADDYGKPQPSIPQEEQLVVEEKKMDEPSAQHQPARAKGVKRQARQASSGSGEQDGRSEYGTSVAMSGTTVMHTNLTSNRRLYSDEDWDSADPPGAKSPSPRSAKPPSGGQELQRRMERIANAQIDSGVEAETMRHAKNLELAQAFMDRERAKASWSAVRMSDSGMSLEYSTDGSSMLLAANQEGVATSPVKMQQAASKPRASEPPPPMSEDGSALSIQESASSVMSEVPTDEELFAVGWAKALDPNSNMYYYFTLDRSKIVWENPLSANHSTMGEPFGA